MPRAPDLSGRTLEERYELHALIGEGTFGRVYRGFDRRLARAVAVKVIKPWWAEDPVWVRRFAREAQLLASLSDPGIVQIYDVGEADEGLYYVAELVEGNSLADRLRRGPLAAERAAAVGEQLCRALGRAHEQGIVHRDVKPANILLSREGALKVGDFGVARLTEGGSHQASATVIGTPQYMSPEQARGEPTTPASDVYGAGIVLYEMLAGRPPFGGEAAVLVALHHLRDAPPPLPGDVPGPLCEIVGRAIAKHPADRYRDGAEMAHALGQVRDGRAIPAREPRRPRRTATARAPVSSPAERPTAVTAPIAAAPGLAVGAGTDGAEAQPLGTAATAAADAPAVPARDDAPTAPTERLRRGRAARGSRRRREHRDARASREPMPADALVPAGARGRPPARPAATLIAPSPSPSPASRRGPRRVAGIAFATIALLAGAGLLAVLLSRPAQTTVPRLIGLHERTIERVADRDHLRATFHTRFASAPRGTAFVQHPGWGSHVRDGTTVSLLVSEGPPPVAVPSVVGDGASAAAARLNALRLRSRVATVPAPGVAPGTVIAQQPQPPATAAAGSSVALQVAEVPSWHTVTTVSGAGGGRSVPFRIRGARWQVNYNMSYQGTCTFIVICFGPHLGVQDLSTGSSVKGLDLSTGPNTQGFQTGPGVYQLRVSPGMDSANWSMTVQDFY